MRRGLALSVAVLFSVGCADPAPGQTAGDSGTVATADTGAVTDGGVTTDANTDGGTVRQCETVFRYAPGRPVRGVSVAGEFNSFSTTALPLRDGGNGIWTATVDIPPGDYGYKLVVDGTDWLLDPAVIARKNVGGTENSRLTVSPCEQPELRVTHATASGDGTLEVSVQYIDGVDRQGTDAMGVRAEIYPGTLPQGAFRFDRETGLATVRLSGLARTKYTLRFNARSARGAQATELVVPMWVEETPYRWGDGPLYFVFTDRFRNGDPTNDGRVGGIAPIADWNGGDFAGVTAAIREGYFDQLGVRALWLSPVNSNTHGAGRGADGRNYAGYHGYWVNQPRETDSHWGSLDELRALTAEAHRHGIRVIFDLVHNQLHREHPYFRDHARDGWFNGDGSCVCGGTNCSWDDRAVDCWFTNYLPDVNWTSMPAADAMINDAWWWLVEADADGFRVDAVKHMNFLSTTNLRARLNQWETGNTEAYTVGETFTGADGRDLIRQYVGPGALRAQFDFPIYWATLGAFAQRQGTMGDLDNAVTASERAYGDAPMSPFLGNHDVERFLSTAAGQLHGDTREQGYNDPPGQPDSDEPYQRMAVAFTFILTQRGVPLIYYGDEIGMPGAADPDNRRPMRFGEGLSARERTLLAHVRAVGTLRSTHPGLRRGVRRTLHTDGDGYVYSRGENSDVAVIALNRGTTDRTVTVHLPPELGLTDGTTLRDGLGGASVTVRNGAIDVSFHPRSSAIYIH